MNILIHPLHGRLMFSWSEITELFDGCLGGNIPISPSLLPVITLLALGVAFAEIDC